MKENAGVPYILTFLVSIIVAAIIYHDNPGLANSIVGITFFLFLSGVVVQFVQKRKEG